MKLDGLHLLLTYQCLYECDHCFVWGSPRQGGTMTLNQIDEILRQASALGSVEWIYFEGGEPFLFYPVLLAGIEASTRAGFKVGVVTNAYWATSVEDAREWLRPLAGKVGDLSLSNDLYHVDPQASHQVEYARTAAVALGLPTGELSVAQPETSCGPVAVGQLPLGQSSVMYRGRAAKQLSGKAALRPWTAFTRCEHEDLRDPGRLHVDPFGNLHICHGLTVGNLFATPLQEVCDAYDPAAHPVVGPLLAGGPVELVRRYDLPHAAEYADCCHLCDDARRQLRVRFPEELAPDQMYGSP
jgi:hypothetical protein